VEIGHWSFTVYRLRFTVRHRLPNCENVDGKRWTVDGKGSTPSGGLAAVHRCGLRRNRRLERRTYAVELPQHLELGVVARQRAIVWIELDRTKENWNGFLHLIALREDGREHIERVVVFGNSEVAARKCARASSKFAAFTASVAANTRSSGVVGDAARGAMCRSQTLR
jgi:hypothetical protein